MSLAEAELLDASIARAIAYGCIVKDKSSNQYTHVPFALTPTPFSRQVFESVKDLQPIFNALVDRVARDKDFLVSIMQDLGKADEFTRRIFEIYQKHWDNGQKIWLGIHRSDYMVHVDESGNESAKQVELNTISASFSSLSSRIGNLHRFTQKLSGNLDADIPPNESGESFADILAEAFKRYGSKDAVIAFVVQPGETNVFDQRHIQERLFEVHNIQTIRKTLAELSEQSTLVGPQKRLFVQGKEIAVAYYRSGYAPTDYPTEKEWKGREIVEESFAIKCPNAAYHLVGAKKIQQVLASPAILERFVTGEHAQRLLNSFTGLYPLDTSTEGLAAYELAIKNPHDYVLKPQREGGGNNFYGDEVKSKLLAMSVTERAGYILMDLIKPHQTTNTLVRRLETLKVEVLSELGIYGVWLSDGDVVLVNKYGGYLLRTKSVTSNEGGVASGYAVLDSPLLV